MTYEGAASDIMRISHGNSDQPKEQQEYYSTSVLQYFYSEHDNLNNQYEYSSTTVFHGDLYPPNVHRWAQKSHQMFLENIRQLYGIREK
jgi:hypothetical protein